MRSIEIPTIIVLGIIIAVAFGWIANIYQLVTVCDFSPDTSYKCEVVRVIGIPVVPVGAIAGYMSINP
jgi:hypothetical protein